MSCTSSDTRVLDTTIYEAEPKERQLTEQKFQRLQLCTAGIVAILLLIIILLSVYAYRQ